MWDTEAPQKGSHMPKNAIAILAKIESKVEDIVDAFKRMVQAKTQLNISQSQKEAHKLQDLEEQITDHKNCWESLNNVWELVTSMQDQNLAYANPAKMKECVNEAEKMLDSFADN